MGHILGRVKGFQVIHFYSFLYFVVRLSVKALDPRPA
jgi:hypothetical protein